jgi:DNA-binding response OmpR family regulator
MPKKNGLDVLQELKADVAFKDMPVIILSNLADDENIKKGLALGAADYFVKTQHSVYEVIEKVQKYLQEK